MSALTKQVFEIFDAHFMKSDCLVVGVSGGPDSTALLHLLVEYTQGRSEAEAKLRRMPHEAMRPKKITWSQVITMPHRPLKVIVAHVNHGIRGKSADRDEKFVRVLASKFKLSFEVRRVRLSGSGLEEKGRNVRRVFFEELKRKHTAQFILTAHTQDDAVETILMNFIRGAGPKGLAGMRTKDNTFLKPLLHIPKADLLTYLRKKKVRYCLDATNADTALTRNRIRKYVLPHLSKINPAYRENILRNAEIFDELSFYVNAEAEKLIENDFCISATRNRAIPRTLLFAAIQLLYQRVSGSRYHLPLRKVLEVEQLIARNIGNKRILCGHGVEFVLRKKNLEAQSKGVRA